MGGNVSIRIIGGQFKNAFYNFGFLFSHIFLAKSLRFYRFQKKIETRLLGRTWWQNSIMLPEHVGASVEGFRHSGNSYLVEHLAQHRGRRFLVGPHRIWSLSAACGKGLPVILLIREPYDCALSLYRRRRNGEQGGRELYFFVILASWFFYYLYAWKYRKQTCVVTLGQQVQNYQHVRRRIEAVLALKMHDVPQSRKINAYEGRPFPVRLSFLSRFLLARAQTLYQQFESYAARQQSAMAGGIKHHTAPRLKPLTVSFGLGAAALLIGTVEAYAYSGVEPYAGLLSLVVQELVTFGLGMIFLLRAAWSLSLFEKSDILENPSPRTESRIAFRMTGAALLFLPGLITNAIGLVLVTGAPAQVLALSACLILFGCSPSGVNLP